MLAHKDRLLDFSLLHITLFAELRDALTVLGGDHLVVMDLLHFFVHALIVSLLELHDLASTLTSLLDLLTRLQLLLLE